MAHNTKSLIVVLGPYRSGTSLACQVLEALGVDFGPSEALIPANRYNPGGYFERWDVNQANTSLLESAGRSLAEPGQPESLGAEADPSQLDQAEVPWPDQGAIWGLKDPRFCATLQAWLEHGRLPQDLRIVQCVRSAEAIVRSSLKHPAVADYFGHDADRAWRMVTQYLDLAECQAQRHRAFRIELDRIAHAPESTVTALAEWLNVSDPRLIRRAVARIGRRSALRRYYVRRAPRKAVELVQRILAGSNP